MIYISIKSNKGASGGGANTFAWNFKNFLDKKKVPFSKNMLFAKAAIVIADRINYPLLWLSKKLGCFIIHRLDEHFSENDPPARIEKHKRIIKINKLADVTVYQSEFVKDNVQPHLNAKNFVVIRNGGNPELFFDDYETERKYIGHVTNSVGDKKRLDLLAKTIEKHKDETFLLVGNHPKSEIGFDRFSNVIMTGPMNKNNLAEKYRQMKCLYFPSENDPCPNTIIESILSGTPVCYNPMGGSVELAGEDCGRPLERFDELLKMWPNLRKNCAKRNDLYFDNVATAYMDLLPESVKNRIII